MANPFLHPQFTLDRSRAEPEFKDIGEATSAYQRVRPLIDQAVGILKANGSRDGEVPGLVAATSVLMANKWHMDGLRFGYNVAGRDVNKLAASLRGKHVDHAESLFQGFFSACLPVAVISQFQGANVLRDLGPEGTIRQGDYSTNVNNVVHSIGDLLATTTINARVAALYEGDRDREARILRKARGLREQIFQTPFYRPLGLHPDYSVGTEPASAILPRLRSFATTVVDALDNPFTAVWEASDGFQSPPVTPDDRVTLLMQLALECPAALDAPKLAKILGRLRWAGVMEFGMCATSISNPMLGISNTSVIDLYSETCRVAACNYGTEASAADEKAASEARFIQWIERCRPNLFETLLKHLGKTGSASGLILPVEALTAVMDAREKPRGTDLIANFVAHAPYGVNQLPVGEGSGTEAEIGRAITTQEELDSGKMKFVGRDVIQSVRDWVAIRMGSLAEELETRATGIVADKRNDDKEAGEVAEALAKCTALTEVVTAKAFLRGLFLAARGVLRTDGTKGFPSQPAKKNALLLKEGARIEAGGVLSADHVPLLTAIFDGLRWKTIDDLPSS